MQTILELSKISKVANSNRVGKNFKYVKTQPTEVLFCQLLARYAAGVTNEEPLRFLLKSGELSIEKGIELARFHRLGPIAQLLLSRLGSNTLARNRHFQQLIANHAHDIRRRNALEKSLRSILRNFGKKMSQ